MGFGKSSALYLAFNEWAMPALGPPTYRWRPMPSITEEELDKCEPILKACLDSNYWLVGKLYSELPDECRRHWRVEFP